MAKRRLTWSPGATLAPGEDPATIGWDLTARGDFPVFTINTPGHDFAIAVLEAAVRDRILACVNACEGIPTDELVAHGVERRVPEPTA